MLSSPQGLTLCLGAEGISRLEPLRTSKAEILSTCSASGAPAAFLFCLCLAQLRLIYPCTRHILLCFSDAACINIFPYSCDTNHRSSSRFGQEDPDVYHIMAVQPACCVQCQWNIWPSKSQAGLISMATYITLVSELPPMKGSGPL